MICAYGRGSDFVCHDSALREQGGVAVICTFFPKTIYDEIQFKGRTCRQQDPGSFVMILYKDDLKPLIGDTSLATLEQGSSVYSVLDQKRTAKLNEQANPTRKAISEAKTKHEGTINATSILAKLSVFNRSPSTQEEESILAHLKQFN